MAQTGYTPISLYYSTTGAAVPTAGNLAAGELALNTNDGKLYYKNSSGVVTLLAGATAGPAGGSTTQIQYNNAGALAGNGAMTFNSGTSTTTLTRLNLTNALGVAYGGTGLTAGTSGGVLAYTATGVLASSAALAANALVIGGGAGAAPSTTTTGTGVLTFLGVPSSANLAAAVTDETGSGALVFGTSPTFTTSVVGGATMAVFNTTSTTVNAFGAATALNIGAATGTLTVANTTLAAKALTATSITNSALTATRLVYSGTAGLEVDSANLTFNGTDLTVSGAVNAGSVNATTLDLTNLEVTNIKAKDGTASIALADTTGIATFSKATVISTTDNTNAALRITQLGTGNALLVEDSANPDATPFVIDTNGNVMSGYTNSINTTAQTGTAVAPGIQQHATVQGFAALGIYSWSSNAGISPNLIFSKSNSGTINTRGTVASGTLLGASVFDGDDGTNFIRAATIEGWVDGTPGTNDMPGRLVFSTTADGASTPTERMRIDSAGRVSIGGTPATGRTLSIEKTITGSVNSRGIINTGVVQSDVTSQAFYYTTVSQTAAAAFTLANLTHYYANQSTIGAGSTVTSQYGFFAESALTGATNNFGFYSNIAAAANRWNFYANGTADNYFAGSVGIGATTVAADTVRVGKNITGAATAQAIYGTGAIQSDVTGAAIYYRTFGNTAAAAFTLSEMSHFRAEQGTIGAGSAVTNQFGYHVNATLTGATSNFGFYSSIAAAANRWNFYANGTARNFMAADLTVSGATAIPAGGTQGAGLMVSTTANFGVFFGSGAPTLSAAKGSLYLRSDGTTVNDRMYVNTNGSTTWTNVVTSA